MRLKYMNIGRMAKFSSVLVFLFFSVGIFAQDAAPVGDPAAGEGLFKNNCASCHNKNMRDDLTGPALGGTEERWADYPREELYAWIRNSQKMINEGHPRAVELWDEWKPTVMTNFTQLTDQQIEDILAYIKGKYEGTFGAPAVAEVAAATDDGAGDESDNTLMFASLAIILVVLALILMRIVGVLNSIAAAKESGEQVDQPTIWDLLSSKTVVSLVLFALVVFGGYTTVNNAISLGRQQGYAPEQPIKFSHETHAGLHQIDCQYCHDGARRSKHSVIPAANTCMNCHRAIKVGSQYGTQELTKIYASIGYNPSTDTYVGGYDSLSNEEIKNIYMKWLTDEYVKAEDMDVIDEKGSQEVEDQWNAIVASLTNDQKKSVAGPIEWVRVHNLPDHVYFNHAQHVTAGQVECQQCHGKVEEMEVLAQYAPLSMGWCINCHRESEVKGFDDNPYYHQEYMKYHEELNNGDREKVTVEDIGGLECQKCHY